MSLLPIPSSIETAPAASQMMLQTVQEQLGVVPNLFRLVSTSPAALEGYLGLSGALSKGNLPARTRERIALAVAEVNQCNYCLSVHSYLAKNMSKLEDTEIIANRRGYSLDNKADAAVKFAVQVTLQRGHLNEAALKTVKDAGYDDAQIIEIVLHVALNTWTNYINSVAKTDIDFPLVPAL